MKLLYFDTETSGVSRDKDEIIQMAGVVEIDNKLIGKFNFKVRPLYAKPETWDLKAQEKHGITFEEAQKFASPVKTFEALIDILNQFVDINDPDDKFFLVAYNAKFDEEFLRKFFNMHSPKNNLGKNIYYYNNYFWTPSVDVMQYANFRYLPYRQKFKNFKLGTVCQALGIEFNEDEAHDAFYDIEKTRDLYLKLQKI